APAPAAAVPAKHHSLCRVHLNLTPWVYYTADGDSTRHETPDTIELTPGPHKLHVWNPELDIERDIVIDVPADRESTNITERLQPSELPSGAPRPDKVRNAWGDPESPTHLRASLRASMVFGAH